MNRQRRWVSAVVGLLVLFGLIARQSRAEDAPQTEPGFTNLITPNTLSGWRLGDEDLTGKTTTADGRFNIDGETIVIARAGRPVAQLSPVTPKSDIIFGGLAGLIVLDDEYFVAADAEVAAMFNDEIDPRR